MYINNYYKKYQLAVRMRIIGRAVASPPVPSN